MLKMKNNFVQIPNVAFTFGTDYKLNNDELKVLAYLQFMKNVGTMNVRTHVTIIVEDLGWSTSKASRDNSRVANALEGLRDKDYISLAFNGDIKKNALAIEITIDELKKTEVQSKVEWKTNPFTFKGHTDVKAKDYNLAEDDYQLTVLAYHNWRANAKFEYAISDNEWGAVLELTPKHSRAIIDSCTFLTKISGEHFTDEKGQLKQETNQYVKTVSVKTPVAEIETANKNMTFLEKEKVKVKDDQIAFFPHIFAQIFDKGTKFEADGYKVWKETECEHSRKAGQAKLDKIGASEKGKFVVERLENNYQERIANERQTEAMMKRHFETMEMDIVDEEAERKAQAEKARIRAEKKAKESRFDFFDED